MTAAPWPSTIARTSTAKSIRLTCRGDLHAFIPTIPGADNVVPSWSRDGKWIYFSSNRGNEPNQIWKVPDAGGSPDSADKDGRNLAERGCRRFCLLFQERSAVMRYGRFLQAAEKKLW